MNGPRAFTAQRISELEQVVLARWTPEAFRRFQCVWLSHVLGLSAPEIAEALDLNVSTVRRIRMQFAQEGSKAIDGNGNRGGRRNQHMTFEEEAAFLREHSELFNRGGSGLVAALKASFERHVGDTVHKTTIYRLLARHGWTRTGVGSRRSTTAISVGSSRRKDGGPVPVSQGRKRRTRKTR